jgi:hypothetical protein
MSAESGQNQDYSFNIAKTDITLGKSDFFEPGQSLWLPTNISMSDFPEGFFENHRERPLFNSMRSSLAQLGMEAQAETSGLISAAGLDAHFRGEDSVRQHVYITNNSEARIFLRKGTGLFRLFQRPKNYISDGYLDDLLKPEGGVYIDGKEQKEDREGDWVRLKDGVAVRIQNDWRKFIPEQPEIIEPNGETNGDHGRTNNEPYLKDVIHRKNPYQPGVWFGKSVPIHLKNVAAEIDLSAYPGFEQGQPHSHAWDHLRSSILDKKKTKHRVIFELFSPTEGNQVVNWVVMRFGYQEG